MQETSVAWEPMYESHLRWFTKAFVSVARGLTLVWWLWRLDMNQQGAEWESCQAKTASIKRLSILTFLLSLLAFAWSTTKILQGVAVQKVAGSAFLAGAIAETLTVFSFGILVCAVLYGFVVFCEGALARRKMAFSQAKRRKQLSAE
jgi:hypothetical protein